MDKIDQVFNLSEDIRYVALYEDDQLTKRSRADLVGASEDESDKYEELLVNPTLIKLTQQRGNIDCGGMEHIIIQYGNFYQLVIPASNGHLSVAIDKTANPLSIYPLLKNLLKKWEK